MKIKQKLAAAWNRFVTEEEAATAVEYSVLLASIVLIAFHSMQLAGFEVQRFYNFNAEQVGDALSPEE